MAADLHGTNTLRGRQAVERRDLAVQPEHLHRQPAEDEQRAGGEAEERANAAARNDAHAVRVCVDVCAGVGAEAEGVSETRVLRCFGADERGEEFERGVEDGQEGERSGVEC